jgi:hypothetical protein
MPRNIISNKKILYEMSRYMIVKHLASQNFLKHHIPLSAPKSSASDTTLSHIFSQQCKPKQLKRYKSFIDNWLNFLKKIEPS